MGLFSLVESLYSDCELAITMSSVTREKCVLKLVYPGHFVELHKNPITVAEVMKKHPRHCVARPDVFRFPWIVVRPDSVLKPGRVFFVVPYHTIRRLLQEKSSQDQSFLQEVHISDDHNQDRLPRLGQKSVFDSSTKSAPEHIGCESFFSRKPHVQPLNYKHTIKYWDDQSPEPNYPIECSVNLTNFHRLLRKQSRKLSQNKEKTKGCPKQKYHAEASSDELHEKSAKKLPTKVKTRSDGDQPPKKRYPVEKWPTAIATYIDHQPHSKPEAQVDPLVEPTAFCHTRKYASESKDHRLQPGTDHESDLKCSKQVAQLKSCLKKHENNASKSRGLRVTFAFPLEDGFNM